MTKKEFYDATAEKAHASKKDTAAILDAALAVFESAMISGDKLALTGIGTFEVSEKGERTARNPRSGETITVPASRSVKFKAGKTLKDAVNK